MCGVISYIKRKEDGKTTAEAIMEMFEAQRTRGTEGFGYVSFDDNLTMYCRRQTRQEIERLIEKNNSRSFLFHHRIPTSTPNFADCAHPIKVSNDELKHDYYVIHNGVISNDSVLHEQHLELGYEYNTTIRNIIETKNDRFVQEKFNDSESLAIDFVRFIEAKQEKMLSRGSIAIIVLQVNKKTGQAERLFWGRNSSPLTIKWTDGELILRSEGETTTVPANKLFCLDIKKWKVNNEDVAIGELVSSYNYPSSYYPQSSTYGRKENIDESLANFLGRSHTPNALPPAGRCSVEGLSDSEIAIIDQDLHERLDKISQMVDFKHEEIELVTDELHEFKQRKDKQAIHDTKQALKKLYEELEDLEREKEDIEYEIMQDMEPTRD